MDKDEFSKDIRSTVHDMFRILDDIDDLLPDSDISQVEYRLKRRIRKKLLDGGNHILALTKQFLGGN